MIADAALLLAALDLALLLAFLTLAGALLCYDQRHGRDTNLDVTDGRRRLHYHSHSHEPANPARQANPGSVHELPTPRTPPTEEQDTPAARRAA
jgi:hypothetical protein